MFRHRRTGFTLVELLVVIAIIGILVALLLPAIQAARESARRTQCSNHLKQLGLGFQHHLDIYKYFPTGGNFLSYAPEYDTSLIPLIAPKQRAGWGFQVLPFIEQKTIWEGNGGQDVAECQRQAIGAKIPTFFCPTRRAPQAPSAGSWYGPSGTYPHAMTDYAGSTSDASITGGAGVVVQVSSSGTWQGPAPITTASIIDGTTYTMVVGEKRLNVNALGTMQSDDNEGYTSGWDHDTMRRVSLDPRPDTTTNYGEERFGSSHPAGFQAVFADGAVRFISFSVDLTTFGRMGNRMDRETFTFN